MRASDEHILIVRVPRAGGRPGCPLFFLRGHPRIPCRFKSPRIKRASPLSSEPLNFPQLSFTFSPSQHRHSGCSSTHRLRTGKTARKGVIRAKAERILRTFDVSLFTFHTKKEGDAIMQKPSSPVSSGNISPAIVGPSKDTKEVYVVGGGSGSCHRHRSLLVLLRAGPVLCHEDPV